MAPKNSTIRILSFGYLHGRPPNVDIIVDLREFRDPHAAEHLRHLTANDREIQDIVLNTPGIRPAIQIAVDKARERLANGQRIVSIAFGCNGGRHRAPTAANKAAADLGITATHRDITKPVINR